MSRMITPPAGAPLTVVVEEDVLTICVGIGRLATAAQKGPEWHSDFRVVDVPRFARAFAREIEGQDGSDDGLSPLQRLFDRTAVAIMESGDPSTDEGSVLEGIVLAEALGAPRLPDEVVEIRGERQRQDAKGRWQAETLFRPQDLLQDELVRELIAAAKDRSGTLAAFRDETLGRVAALQALLDQQYEVEKGGAKGNVTLTTIHPTQRVEVRVNDLISFGPELAQAKALIDDCLSGWATDAHPVIRALVLRAFNVEQEGRANRGDLLGLLRMDVDDERWARAMQAIRDSIRVDGTATYVRFQERDPIDSGFTPWRTISLDIARA